MPTARTETIRAAIISRIETITTGNGYATDLVAANVGKTLVQPRKLETEQLPNVQVVLADADNDTGAQKQTRDDVRVANYIVQQYIESADDVDAMNLQADIEYAVTQKVSGQYLGLGPWVRYVWVGRVTMFNARSEALRNAVRFTETEIGVRYTNVGRNPYSP